MTFDQWLQLFQAASVGLLWLFLFGRWVGKTDSRDALQKPTSILRAETATLPGLALEMRNARDRLHKLEGGQQRTDVRLNYITRDLEHVTQRVDRHLDQRLED